MECIGHVQKRMGSRLSKLKGQMSKEKLVDGKSLGGRGRLTEVMINEIQLYYGLAIRRNVNSVQDMKTAIWADYFHLSSTNEEPIHGLCPKMSDTWCKYIKAQAKKEEYDHSKHSHLPPVVMKAIKPIFQDLSNPLLLQKCLHGRTQNAKESLNNLIWTRIPKNVFVHRKTLEFGVYEAVSTFNLGNITKCLVFEKIGLEPGLNCVSALKSDEQRIKSAEKSIQEIYKRCRQHSQTARKVLEDQYEEQEDPDDPAYGAGMH